MLINSNLSITFTNLHVFIKLYCDVSKRFYIQPKSYFYTTNVNLSCSSSPNYVYEGLNLRCKYNARSPFCVYEVI